MSYDAPLKPRGITIHLTIGELVWTLMEARDRNKEHLQQQESEYINRRADERNVLGLIQG